MRDSTGRFGYLIRPTLSFRQALAAFVCIAAVYAAIPARAAESPAPSVQLKGERVLVLGDSITQDGRYVSFLEYELLHASTPVHCDLISIGLSSETISGLSEKGHPYPRPFVLERLTRALKAVKPTVVLACYGMNDGIYHPVSAERIAAFTSGLHQFISTVQASGARLVLVTPPVFDPVPIAARVVSAGAPNFGYDTPFDHYDDVLAEFSRIELTLRDSGLTVIDLHSAMAADLKARRERDPQFSFTTDGVHPGDLGHALMARIVVTGLGYEAGPELNSAESVARLKSDPLFKLVDDRRRLRSEAWLPFVGYTRGDTFKSASVDAAVKVVGHLGGEIDSLVR
jgi:lysophospholipase L1-like esterase